MKTRLHGNLSEENSRQQRLFVKTNHDNSLTRVSTQIILETRIRLLSAV
jgi:hypothetical protein